MAVNGSCCLLGDTDERLWFGILTCSTAKLTSVNVVSEKHQGLGTEGSEMPRPLSHSVSEIWLKLGHGTGSQLPVEVPSLMEDIPSPTSASFLLAIQVVDRNQVRDV